MRVAIVEWWPRVCGAVTWALHLSHARPPRGATVDRLTFSSSGRPLAAWDRPELWQVHRVRDAVEVLDSYDLVILSDIVCCAPAATKDPHYVDVLNRMRTPWTAMVHDGAYRSKHDATLRAVLASPSFSGALITTRLREARARVDPFAAKPIRWLARPYLPYSFAYQPAPATPPLRRRAAHGIIMTSRIAVNKGQNVALYLAPRIGADLHLFGYNAFGLPSIGWRLWELAVALKYKPVKGASPPSLRRDAARLTHPRANRFYTGAFAMLADANRVEYHDGFDGLGDVDWSLGRVHLSLSNESVRGTLEYATLEAVAAGAVTVVPAHAIEYAKYAAGAFPTVPYTRAAIWAKKDGTPQLKFDGEELAGTVKVLAELVRYTPVGKLERLAAAQRRELEEKHDPDAILKALIHHAGGSHGSRNLSLVRCAPERRRQGIREPGRGDRGGAAGRRRVTPTARRDGADRGDDQRQLGLFGGRHQQPGAERQGDVPEARVKKRGRLKAIGANIFAGGFTVGVAKHFDVVAHLEHDDYGVEVARANFPELRIFVGADTWPEKLPPGKELDFLYSNPPCAIWSLAGNMSGKDWQKDPRLGRIRDIHALIARYRPAVWAWESVCQAFERGREFVESLADAAAALGYSASYVLVDAAYLRAPQTRKRFFLVLHRVAIDWKAATPDFAAKPITAGEALRGVKPVILPAIRPADYIEKPLFRHVGPGERFTAAWERLNAGKPVRRNKNGKVIGRPGWLKVRLDPAKVTGVVFGDSTFHWKEDRLLAMSELGALHGFPPGFDWVSNRHRLAVPRGVLPPVAEWLAAAVARAVRAGVAVREPIRTLADFRRPPGVITDKIGQLSADGGGPGPSPGGGRAPKVPKARSSARATGTGGQDGASESPGPRAGRPRPAGKPRVEATAAGLRDAVRQLNFDKIPPTSGELIRARLFEGKYDDGEIAAEVRKRYSGRKTTVADVAWNRNQLRLLGLAKGEAA